MLNKIANKKIKKNISKNFDLYKILNIIFIIT